jgi:hypothetical protein
VDGIFFDDRLRYANANADFSESTRAEFEKYVGKKLRWPSDVFEITFSTALTKGIRPGKWYDTWMAWRALTLRNWLARVRSTIESTRPGSKLGVYVGSTFGESNWSSPEFAAGFPYLTSGYQKAGFAPLLDILVSGCYYTTGTIAQAMETAVPTGRTVEAAGMLSNRATRDQCWTYAGLMLANFYGNPRELESCLQAAAGTTQGIMIFDLSHKIDFFWDTLERAFKVPAKAPDTVPGLLNQIRGTRRSLDRIRAKELPVPIYDFASGVGQ